MSRQFLPRAHSRRLGELDRSNWKNLRIGQNVTRIDPAIKEIVLLLNNKGYGTFSSCSGGHGTDPRWKTDRHLSGYLAFSPPSRIAFTLYLELRKQNRDFGFEAQAVMDNDETERETVCTRLYWQLLDEREAKLEYYRKLFSQMKSIIEALPTARDDHQSVMTGLLGRKRIAVGRRILTRQTKRFAA